MLSDIQIIYTHYDIVLLRVKFAAENAIDITPQAYCAMPAEKVTKLDIWCEMIPARGGRLLTSFRSAGMKLLRITLREQLLRWAARSW